MNKLNLLLLAGAAALASCASEDVINSGDINPPTGGQAMSFGVLTGNHSRAGMEADGHKDFGVFAYKGENMTTGLVMNNYWVKYAASADDDGSNTTWGNASNLEDGLSKWYYEGVSGHSQAGTAQAQVLKYWDYSFTNHYFVAYTPYNNDAALRTLLEAKSSEASYTDLKSDLHILGANIFWTEAERDNNEAMWATHNVAKADYNKDVTLAFNHLNAVVRLAFRSNIPGYTVKLINLVPADITVNGVTTSATNGVQLTPASSDQADDAINWTATDPAAPAPQPTLSKKYATQVNFTVADVFGAATKTTTVVTDVTDNLVFHLSETAGAADERLAIKAGASAEYTKLGSQFFALPLSDYTGIHETGYTLHVSYVLIPNDHAAETIVYDARVFIPADKCKWEYGKAYTYNFTITTGSTGVTDPNTPIYDDGSTQSPYVDPTDPRVSGNALRPIVFDGVTVTDYETATDSDHKING